MTFLPTPMRWPFSTRANPSGQRTEGAAAKPDLGRPVTLVDADAAARNHQANTMTKENWKRWINAGCGFLAMVGATGSEAVSAAGTEDHPNIVFIISDDSGWGDVGWNGNKVLEAPVLDRLKQRSVELTRFYVAPTCAPTRAALLTGRHPLRTGVVNTTRGLQVLDGSEVTIAEALKAGGYATGYFGKWHNGANHPWTAQAQGFDEFVGFNGGFIPNYFDTPMEFNGVVKPSEGFITDVLTDEAMAFIEKNRGRPFFCYLSYNVPHSPFQAPADLYDKYYERLGVENLKRGNERLQAERTAAVYAMLENMDTNIGRLLEELQKLGLEGKTIVIYTTDNGPSTARYNGPLRAGKGTLYEGGVKVPFIISYPDQLEAGKVVPTLAMHVDLYPTLLELAGVAAPEGPAIDGKSLVPLLKGTASDWPERYYFGIKNRGGRDGVPIKLYPGTVISERHKYVNAEDTVELYDLEADPEEKRNLAEAEPELVATMSGAYEKWFQEMTAENGAKIRIRPFQLGEGTDLLVSEASFHGGAKFFGRGFDFDWAVGLEKPGAAVFWPFDAASGGEYRVEVLYTAKQPGHIEVRVGNESIKAEITEPYDPAYVPSPDYSKRIEVYEKPFRPLLIGTVNIPAGAGEVRVSASEGAEVQSVRMQRL
jgi:arylsulfatase A-like enzyme